MAILCPPKEAFFPLSHLFTPTMKTWFSIDRDKRRALQNLIYSVFQAPGTKITLAPLEARYCAISGNSAN